MARKSVVVSISLAPELVRLMDRLAAAEARGRSELVREALRYYAAGRERWGELQAYGRRRARERGLRATDLERLVGKYRLGR